MILPRRLTATVLAVGAALTFAASAQAESDTLDTKGLIAPGGLSATTKGYALTTFTVLFPTKKTFTISGVVRDVCPSDGNGAYVRYDYYTNGVDGGDYLPGGIAGKDTNGCGTGSEQFSIGIPKKWSLLDGVRVWVCEHDASDKDNSKDSCTFPKAYDNPLS